jgi:hypothetical protein
MTERESGRKEMFRWRRVEDLISSSLEHFRFRGVTRRDQDKQKNEREQRSVKDLAHYGVDSDNLENYSQKSKFMSPLERPNSDCEHPNYWQNVSLTLIFHESNEEGIYNNGIIKYLQVIYDLLAQLLKIRKSQHHIICFSQNYKTL